MPGSLLHWDIVRIDFPHAGSQVVGLRPALVVATPAATDTFGTVWVLMIASARHSPWPDDVAVSDLDAAGLSHASVIRTGKIAAINSRLVTPIGYLSEANRAAVSDRLKQHICGVLLA